MITKEQAFGMYIGQKITDRDNDIPITKLKGIKNVDNILYCQFFDGEFKSRYLSDCKLILRPFGNMTDEEEKEFYNKTGFGIWKSHQYITGFSESGLISIEEMVVCSEYLISIGIDVFNLRERGWAVYESDLKGENNETN